MRALLATLALLALLAPQAPAQPLEVRDPRVEHLVAPLGIGETQPRFSWEVASPRRGAAQDAYQVLVASTPGLLREGSADLWDSGRVESSATFGVEYDGAPLASGDWAYWSVRAWDEAGAPSPWSEPARFSLGLLHEADWQADWIGDDSVVLHVSGRLDGASWIWPAVDAHDPLVSVPRGNVSFRRVVELPDGATVKSAQFIVTADDRANVTVNGVALEQDPKVADDWRRASLLDVASLLRPGANEFVVNTRNTSTSPAGMIGRITIELESGESIVVVTDAAWEATREGEPPVAPLVLAPHGEGPWTRDVGLGDGHPPARRLRTEFTLGEPVQRATLHVAAMGIVDPFLNGERVTSDYFLTGWTDYPTRVPSRAYDVTHLLREGENALAVDLADGWYSGELGLGGKRAQYGESPRLRAQLEVTLASGETVTIATGGDWRSDTTGPIRRADLLDGETFDARIDDAAWKLPGFDDSGWRAADVTPAASVPAVTWPHPGPPVVAFAEVPAVAITAPDPGTFIFDLGRNFAGVARLRVQAPRGTVVRLRHAERLDADGRLYTANLRAVRAIDEYICSGEGVEQWTPRFTFHGFQFVEVTGLPEPPSLDTVTGVALSSDTPRAGWLETSDPMINTLVENAWWTQRANFIDVPTDCPQRDERLGWTGDAQVYVSTAAKLADVSAFFTKWLVDLEDGQLPDGAFPDVAPMITHGGRGAAAWGDAGVICPWNIWLDYGDKRVLEEHYDAMVRWIEYLRANSDGLLRPDSGYGDWLSIDSKTPKDVIGTAYFAHSTDLVARVAEILGREEDAARHRQLFQEIRAAFNKAYVSEDGVVMGDTQTGQVLALHFGLLDEPQRALAVRHLVDDINERGVLTTGFVGTRDIMHVLSSNGELDAAFLLLHSDRFPSWGFPIKHGATSIWERWDGWTPEKGFQNPGMNSFSHYAYGAVVGWIFNVVAGIEQAEPGFGRLRIHPRPGPQLDWARARHDTIRGPVITEWERADGSFRLVVEIPANTDADVMLPVPTGAAVTEGGVALADVEGVSEVDGVGFVLASGRYEFDARW